DRATYDDPHQYAVGVSTVLVNGEVVVDGGSHTGSLAGRVLRRPPDTPVVALPAKSRLPTMRGLPVGRLSGWIRLLTGGNCCKVTRLSLDGLLVRPLSPGRKDAMRTRRVLAGFAIACIAALPLITDAQEPKRAGNLRVAYGNEISNLDF